MSVPFSIRCPKCKTKLTIKKKELIGKQAPCPKCQTKLVIQPPAPQPVAPALAADPELPDVGLSNPVDAEPKEAAAKPTKMPVKAPLTTKTKKAKRKRKKPAPVEDDFLDDFDEPEDSFDDSDDDFEDDDFEEVTPTKRGTGKPGGKSKKSAGKKKGKSGSKAPIIIVASVLGIGLVGGLTWFLWPGDNDSTTVADTGNKTDTATDAAADKSGTDKASADTKTVPVSNDNDKANAEQPGADARLATTDNDATPPAGGGFNPNNFASQGFNSTGSATGAAAAPAGPATFDVAYLPVDAEVFIRLDVESMYNAPPIQMLLSNPALAQQIDQVTQEIGIGLADVKSVTVGVPDVMQIASQMTPGMMGGMGPGGPGGRRMQPGGPPGGFPPNGGLRPGNAPPGAMPPGAFPTAGGSAAPENPGVAVIRLKTGIDAAQIQKLEPKFQRSSHAGKSYLRMNTPQQPAGLWQPDPATIVTGTEDNVKQIMDQGSALPTADLSFVNPNANFLMVFAPREPDKYFRANPAAGAQVPPQVKPAVDSLINQTDALSIGIDLNTDLGLVASILCKTPDGAAQLHQNLEPLMPMALGMLQQQMQQAPMMQKGYMTMGENLLKSIQFSHTDRHFHLAGKSAGAGKTLAAQASMMIPMMLPAITAARGAARRTQSQNNLKQIGLAMMNSHEVNRKYPDLASTHADTGKSLLSWRVHMLPFLEQQALYEQFKLDEPWDSPHNKPLVEMIPPVYVSPAAELDSGFTTYLAATGPETVFENGKGKGLRDITDGSSNTILIVEVDEEAAVPWTKPADFTLNPSDVWTGIGATYENGFQAVFCDAHVEFIGSDTDDDILKAMFTCAGGEPIR